MDQLFSAAREQADFGNGRYVRNVIEKAQLAQAVRCSIRIMTGLQIKIL